MYFTAVHLSLRMKGINKTHFVWIEKYYLIYFFTCTQLLLTSFIPFLLKLEPLS